MIRLLSFDRGHGYTLHKFYNLPLPAYAILSHTWDTNNDNEVSFADLEPGKAKNKLGHRKPGYRKLEFCAAMAARDGLQYFWIDTCCINRRSEPEISEAINSMFRWYQQAARCYVYLADISGHEQSRTEAFQTCRWFTRGWTLQELIAPKFVEFYGGDGQRLGDKSSMEDVISRVTGIPLEALRGRQLGEFSIAERKSWLSRRQTKREEDMVYCLLGIFGVSMPVIYGEGIAKASRRLDNEINSLVKGTVLQLTGQYFGAYIPQMFMSITLTLVSRACQT